LDGARREIDLDYRIVRRGVKITVRRKGKTVTIGIRGNGARRGLASRIDDLKMLNTHNRSRANRASFH
jgi:hypothetical protein